MRQTEKNVSRKGVFQDTYVKQKIVNTLFDLLKKYHLSQISISALCETAEVSRASFYRNFSSKEDIFKQYDKDLIEAWGIEFGTDENSTVETLIPSLLLHYKKHQDFYFMLYQEHLSNIVLDTILYACQLHEKKTNMEAYITSFIGYGIFGIVNEWIARGMEETPEQLFSLIKNNQVNR